MEYLEAIGGISGIVAFFGFIWTILFQLAKVKVRTDTLWEIYIIEALKSRYVQHSSPFSPKQECEGIIPDDIKATLSKLARKAGKKELVEISSDVVRQVGVTRIYELSNNHEITLQEAIGLLIAYVDRERNRVNQGG